MARVKILAIEELTHDVRKYTCKRPSKYDFTPGQATEVALDKDDWKDKKRPFTYTSLPSDQHLEFTIKTYPDHGGVTEQLGQASAGDNFLIDDAWGAIEYKGPGLFIAGGAGITPFISIIRQLVEKGELQGNRLIFSNKTAKDVIMESYWRQTFGPNFTSTLTEEESPGHDHRKIDQDYLKDQIRSVDQYFYICGPDKMVSDIAEALQKLDVKKEKIIHEDLS